MYVSLTHTYAHMYVYVCISVDKYVRIVDGGK